MSPSQGDWELYPVIEQEHLSWRKRPGFQEEEGGLDFQSDFFSQETFIR